MCRRNSLITETIIWAQDLAGTGVTVSAVGDLQYLDSNADLFFDFDALDDAQSETN